MYKILLCLRYLRTRPIGLASIVSVMLGVMTLIVVNAVMEGFSSEMRRQMHGVLSDVIVEARSLNGEANADMYLEGIRQVCGNRVAAATEVVATPAMLSFRVGEGCTTHDVQIVGIDPDRQGEVTEFRNYLQHPENRGLPSFQLREDGYPNHEWNEMGEATKGGVRRDDLAAGGWKHRRNLASYEQFRRLTRSPERLDVPRVPPDTLARDPSLPALPTLEFPDESLPPSDVKLHAATPDGPASVSELPAPDGVSEISHPGVPPSHIETGPSILMPRDVPISSLPSLDHLNDTGVYENNQEPADTPAPATGNTEALADPFRSLGEDPFGSLHRITGRDQFDMARDQNPGAIPGIAIVTARRELPPSGSGEYEDRFLLIPGNDINLTFLTVGDLPQACSASFTIVDFYESRMSQYDRSFVFVPINTLREMRGMDRGGFSQILIRVLPGESPNEVCRTLCESKLFPMELFQVYTWEEKGDVRDLLNAVQIELLMINLLLFLIIAVAGFGILAIFFMIVFEKTRDIGILKSLGASGRGVMMIFLAYGLTLGTVGSLAGLGLGLLIVKYINVIASWLAKMTGVVIFDPTIYYLYKIPTIVMPGTVLRVILGSLAIAVMASVLPAIRAARLHPVRALRHE